MKFEVELRTSSGKRKTIELEEDDLEAVDWSASEVAKAMRDSTGEMVEYRIVDPDGRFEWKT